MCILMNMIHLCVCTNKLIILTAVLYLIVSLIVTWANMDDLVSYAEFSDKEEKRIQKKIAKKMNKQ